MSCYKWDNTLLSFDSTLHTFDFICVFPEYETITCTSNFKITTQCVSNFKLVKTQISKIKLKLEEKSSFKAIEAHTSDIKLNLEGESNFKYKIIKNE